MKKIILGLFICFFSFLSFCYCSVFERVTISVNSSTSYTWTCDWLCCFTSSSSSANRKNFIINYNNVNDYFLSWTSTNSLVCLSINWSYSISYPSSSTQYVYLYSLGSVGSSFNVSIFSWWFTSDKFLTDFNFKDYLFIDKSNTNFVVWSWNYGFWSVDTLTFTSSCSSSQCPEVPECPAASEYPTILSFDWVVLDLSWYNQVALNSINNVSYWGYESIINWDDHIMYVSINNDLTWWICTWDIIWEWDWSALFINWIQHVWAPLINITIPEEYNRNYTWTEEVFDLSVDWYNVDYEYIDNIINTQNSKPNSNDLTIIISQLIPLFVPWLCIILLLYFIYIFIKKIF